MTGIEQIAEDAKNTKSKTFPAVFFLAAWAIAFSMGASGYALYDRTDEAKTVERALRVSDRRQLNAIRTILCLARVQTMTSRQRTPAEKRERLKFYDKALRSVHAKPCEPVKG